MRLLLIVCLAISPTLLSAQDYLVYFADKGPDLSQQLRSVRTHFSAKSLARRALQGQPFDVYDLPVCKQYLHTVSSYGTLHGSSRWLNAVLVQTENPAAIQTLPFVKKIVPYLDNGTHVSATQETINHGYAKIGIEQLKLQALHNGGFLGAGIPIGVFDSGFVSAHTNWAFTKVYANNRLLDAYDFQNNSPDVYDFDNHGTTVWSIMASDSAAFFVGSAPQADYALYRTEVTASETRQELWNWVRAAERADSVGLWLINNSLGYNTFDNPDSNYVQADMDGNTTIITRAADLAASRGMLVVSSAGNEGSGLWGTITAPCDGDSVLCVGAINEFEECATDFSGDGPTADGRIKPEVVALGRGTPYISTIGQRRNGNGTSLSAPLITGLAACLWQKHPSASNMMVYEAIRQSADRFLNPDNCLGYGVPDAEKADQLLQQMTSRHEVLNAKSHLFVGGNPITGNTISCWIQQPNTGRYTLQIFDLQGRLLKELNDWPSGVKATIDVNDLAEGVYLLKANGERQLTKRVVIQR